MDALALTEAACCLVTSVAAWMVTRRERRHWPVAAFLTWILASDGLASVLKAGRATAPRPYAGLARVSFHVDQLITLSWSFLLVALCVHFFLRKRVRFVLIGWAVTIGVCAASYPALSKDRLSFFYEAVALGAVAVCWGSILRGLIARRHSRPSISHFILILYCAVDAAIFVVRVNQRFFDGWPLVLLADILLYLSCLTAQAVWLLRWRPRIPVGDTTDAPEPGGETISPFDPSAASEVE